MKISFSRNELMSTLLDLCSIIKTELVFNGSLVWFSSVCYRSLVSWACCGASASSPVCTQTTPTFPCKSTRSSSMASWCSSSSTPSRPATTNPVSGSSSCWSVQSVIYWSICETFVSNNYCDALWTLVPPIIFSERVGECVWAQDWNQTGLNKERCWQLWPSSMQCLRAVKLNHKGGQTTQKTVSTSRAKWGQHLLNQHHDKLLRQKYELTVPETSYRIQNKARISDKNKQEVKFKIKYSIIHLLCLPLCQWIFAVFKIFTFVIPI